MLTILFPAGGVPLHSRRGGGVRVDGGGGGRGQHVTEKVFHRHSQPKGAQKGHGHDLFSQRRHG